MNKNDATVHDMRILRDNAKEAGATTVDEFYDWLIEEAGITFNYDRIKNFWNTGGW